MSFVRSWIYVMITAVVYPLVAVLLIVLLVVHCWMLHHYLSKKQSNPRLHQLRRSSSGKRLRNRFGDWKIHSIIVTYGTPVFIALSIFSASQNAVARLGPLFNLTPTCQFLAISVGMTWFLSKGTLYSVFIARLHLSFKQSLYRYSIEFIIGLYSLNLFLCLLGVVTVPWVLEGRRDIAKNGPKKDLKLCVAHFLHHRVGAIFVVLNDWLWTVTFVYLFCKPLRSLLYNHRQTQTEHSVSSPMDSGNGGSIGGNKLTLSRSNSSQKPRGYLNDELNMLPIKYTLLTGVSTISTALMVIMSGMLSASVFVVMDYLINTVCLLLMTKHWKRSYNFLCGSFADFLASTRCGLFVARAGSVSSNSTLSPMFVDSSPKRVIKPLPINVHSPTSMDSDTEFPTVSGAHTP